MWSTFYFSALFIKLKLYKVRKTLICIDFNRDDVFSMYSVFLNGLIEMLKQYSCSSGFILAPEQTSSAPESHVGFFFSKSFFIKNGTQTRKGFLGILLRKKHQT